MLFRSEMANCMIQSKGLSLQYWAEAINCANYIVNHTPTKFLQDIRLEEACSKIKLDVSHFSVFGCEAWVHIPDEKQKALHPKIEKCIFVAYSKDVKGYRILQPHSHDIIIRRYVKFDENLLAYEPNLAGVPSLACEPDSTIVPSSSSSSSFLNSFLTPIFDDDSEDENPPPPAHIPLVSPAPLLPRWVPSTCEAVGDVVGDLRSTSNTFSDSMSLFSFGSSL